MYKEYYENVEIELIRIAAHDIITSSDGNTPGAGTGDDTEFDEG